MNRSAIALRKRKGDRHPGSPQQRPRVAVSLHAHSVAYKTYFSCVCRPNDRHRSACSQLSGIAQATRRELCQLKAPRWIGLGLHPEVRIDFPFSPPSHAPVTSSRTRSLTRRPRRAKITDHNTGRRSMPSRNQDMVSAGTLPTTRGPRHVSLTTWLPADGNDQLPYLVRIFTGSPHDNGPFAHAYTRPDSGWVVCVKNPAAYRTSASAGRATGARARARHPRTR